MLRSWDMIGQRHDREMFQQEAIICHYVTAVTPSGGSPVPAAIGGGNYDTSYVQAPLYTDQVSVIYARVMWFDPGTIRLGMVPPGPNMGDVTLGMDLHYQTYLDTLADSKYSYLVVNNRYVRPRSSLAMRVTGPTTLELVCQMINVTDIVQVITPVPPVGTCDGTQLIFSCPENSGHLATTGWMAYG